MGWSALSAGEKLTAAKYNERLASYLVYDHTTPVILDSYNVDSVADEGTGLLDITWSTAFADSTYVIAGAGQNGYYISGRTPNPQASHADVQVLNYNGTLSDRNYVAVIAIGDQT